MLDLYKAMGKKRGKIWLLLIKEPGITITEIAEKIHLPQPPVTRYIHDLEKNKMVRVEFDDKGKGIKKRCYPSCRGMFEDIANKFGKTFPDEVYENIDKVLLHDDIEKIMFDVLPKNNTDNITSIVSIMISVFTPKTFERMGKVLEKKENDELRKAYDDGLVVWVNKLQERMNLIKKI